MPIYQAEANESVILQKEHIYISGTVNCFANTVLVTNQYFVIEYMSGLRSNQYHIEKFPLIELGQVQGKPDIQLKESPEEPILALHFLNERFFLHFIGLGSEEAVECINEWIAKMCRAFYELQSSESFETTSILKNV